MGQSTSIFVEEPPEFEFRDGLFHVVHINGTERCERVMLPSVFARAIWRAEQALAQFRRGADVVEIRAKVPPEEAACGGH